MSPSVFFAWHGEKVLSALMQRRTLVLTKKKWLYMVLSIYNFNLISRHINYGYERQTETSAHCLLVFLHGTGLKKVPARY
ncbi:hypothetical protein COE80_08375 [Bacillus pseudomycoides]|nr:hypothetical protein COE80_08375 [Bacillus pseudomycoides]